MNDKNILETHYVQKNRTEVHVKGMSEFELWQVETGIIKEWKKLLDRGSLHRDPRWQEGPKTAGDQLKSQILKSRFVKTRREKPDEPGVQELQGVQGCGSSGCGQESAYAGGGHADAAGHSIFLVETAGGRY